MPKGLYFTAVVFSFFFFRRLIYEVTERISTKWTHSLSTAIWIIWSERPRAFTPHGLGGKSAILGPTLNFNQTYLCNGTWCQQSKRNWSIYRDSPTCPPNLVTFGPETAENGWRVFSHPLNFCIGWHCQPYRMDSRQTLARVM